jgi:hypothetical protein
MIVVFKVAAMLTRNWRLSRASSAVASAAGNVFAGGQQQPALMAAVASATAAAPAIASDRVRSTVASLETTATSHRISTAAAMQPALPAPTPRLAIGSPEGARNQLRYLHHRVAGGSPNNVSREVLR